MNFEVLKDVLYYPNDNGILIFVLGFLFALSIYNFLLFFQQKDKVYLFYSIYTFLIFISHLDLVTNGFIPILTKPIINTLGYYSLNLVWVYNIFYFIFLFTFIDIKSYSLKWYKFIVFYVLFLFVFCISLEIIYSFNNNISTIVNGNIIFSILITIFTLLVYIPLFKMPNPLKLYAIFGAVSLFVASIIATIIFIFNLTSEGNDIRFSIFYLGIILENIFFSLGLGKKQKIILEKNNNYQNNIIKQLKDNEELRQTIQNKLEKDVILLNEKAETEKIEKLKAKYDKELIELKMSSLRNQMNPHFIFNSLNAIKLYIIDNETKNAVYYLNKFSKLIRKILNATREKEIKLIDEIETLKLYIEIENIRFNNAIESSFKIDKNLNLNTIKTPSLLFQPFIENAIWHGLSSKKGIKKLGISIEKEKETHLKFTLTDNGIGREKSAKIKANKIHKKESVGIKLTKERLTNFYKDYEYTYSLNFIDLYDNQKQAVGTKVILRMPLK